MITALLDNKCASKQFINFYNNNNNDNNDDDDDNNNNNNNKHICKAPYGRNFRGAGGSVC